MDEPMNRLNITYRKLIPVDSGQYRQIRLESLKAHPENFGASYEEQKTLTKLMFEEAIEKPVDDRFMMGAFDQERLIGIFGLVPFSLGDMLDLNNTGTIIQMYVTKAYRGKKVGLKLTQAVVSEAFNLPDIDQVILGVRKDNITAIRVYEQAGFLIYPLTADDPAVSNPKFQIMILRCKR